MTEANARYTQTYPICMEDAGLRRQHFPQLYRSDDGVNNTTYLDHAGATLASAGQLEAYFTDIGMNLYGNSHSNGPASAPTYASIEKVRNKILLHYVIS